MASLQTPEPRHRWIGMLTGQRLTLNKAADITEIASFLEQEGLTECAERIRTLQVLETEEFANGDLPMKTECVRDFATLALAARKLGYEKAGITAPAQGWIDASWHIHGNPVFWLEIRENHKVFRFGNGPWENRSGIGTLQEALHLMVEAAKQ